MISLLIVGEKVLSGHCDVYGGHLDRGGHGGAHLGAPDKQLYRHGI